MMLSDDSMKCATAEIAPFIHELVHDVPALQAVLDQHLQDFGELLTHLFMGDVARWAAARAEISLDDKEIDKLLSFFESRYATSNIWVKNLINVSFIEYLGYESPLATRFGPQMREAYVELWEYLSRLAVAANDATVPRKKPWWRK
ncbi:MULTISPECIES: hypothetical protein [unclassified Salinibacterium]|uniref:DUF7674 family protein n=1 Tax=unclassified Salinibacterium TaxID=2632331 RepID=UPI0018CDF9CF|nr:MULTISPECIES: hypothetical protein [unclassified Salinibacterium]MBH0053739.1 hypothetical protein [Salinibacterium sp. SWN139]MBH0083013.1 hypothetical protein [Salinibacterium sp. SWN167]